MWLKVISVLPFLFDQSPTAAPEPFTRYSTPNDISRTFYFFFFSHPYLSSPQLIERAFHFLLNFGYEISPLFLSLFYLFPPKPCCVLTLVLN